MDSKRDLKRELSQLILNSLTDEVGKYCQKVLPPSVHFIVVTVDAPKGVCASTMSEKNEAYVAVLREVADSIERQLKGN